MFKTDDAYFSMLVRAEARALVVEILSRVADTIDHQNALIQQSGHPTRPPSVSGAIRTAVKDVTSAYGSSCDQQTTTEPRLPRSTSSSL